MASADRITLQVARYRPEEESEPTFQDYEVPCPQGLGGPRRAQLHQGPAWTARCRTAGRAAWASAAAAG